jgi:hypothetical protein
MTTVAGERRQELRREGREFDRLNLIDEPSCQKAAQA